MRDDRRGDATRDASSGLRRRRFLAGAGTAALAGAAGCASLFGIEQRSAFAAPPVVADRPDAVYYPTHVEQMRVVDVQNQSGYACALTYTYPHRFWTTSGTHTRKVTIRPEDAVHLMPVVWDAETGTNLTDVAPTLRVSRSGSTVLSDTPWPMLSQPMGWHFGDNVRLPSEGTYDVTVHVGAPAARRTGRLADAPSKVAFEFAFDYSRSTLEGIPWHRLPDRKGTRGAVSHMDVQRLPPSSTPARADLPGTVVGSGTSGDATFVLTVLDDATRFGGDADQSYLAVSPRTPYNRYVLPRMGLSLAQSRGSSQVVDTDLTETLDPDLGLHYGTVLDGVESGDSLAVRVSLPPQIARHEGYETAFVRMDDVAVTV